MLLSKSLMDRRSGTAGAAFLIKAFSRPIKALRPLFSSSDEDSEALEPESCFAGAGFLAGPV
jgi:hypothetical protein